MFDMKIVGITVLPFQFLFDFFNNNTGSAIVTANNKFCAHHNAVQNTLNISNTEMAMKLGVLVGLLKGLEFFEQNKPRTKSTHFGRYDEDHGASLG